MILIDTNILLALSGMDDVNPQIANKEAKQKDIFLRLRCIKGEERPVFA